MSKSLTTARQVRSFYAENPARLAGLSPEAQATLAPGARGRLHPEVRSDFNSDHKGKAAYAEGTPKTVAVTYRHTQPSGRKVTKVAMVPEREVRVLAGPLAGKRGPLSKAAMSAAGEKFAAKVSKP